jgi:hypothetical protein
LDPYRGITPLSQTIIPWGWRQSAKAFEAACHRYLPVFADEKEVTA